MEPAHKFARANSFRDLTPPLRDFATPKVELRNGAEPHGLILRARRKPRVSKDGPAPCLVCASRSVLRGRFAPPQDEVVGSYATFSLLQPRPRPGTGALQGGRRPGGCVSGVDGAQKRRKRKESFALRNERFRDAGRKSLKSLGCEIGRFREIVCFQWANRLFVSRFRRTRSPDPKTRSNGSRGALIEAASWTILRDAMLRIAP